MITLGIETSCDETSCAILEGEQNLLSNIISSSLNRHKPYGGIVPEIASRHSLENIQIVFDEALKKAKKKISDIDLISVTYGPGLIGSLLVGVSFAKALSFSNKIPLVGVNHLIAHMEANLIEHSRPKGDYLGVVVSGGHSMLLHCKKGQYQKIGTTIDDAIGEAYDKVAKLMGLGYPGGPIMDRLAREGDPHCYRFTKPKLKSSLDFSFSGIKTAMLYLIRDLNGKLESEKNHLAASFQHNVTEWIVLAVEEAIKKTNSKHVLVGGGVSANSLLRTKLQDLGKKLSVDIWIPPLALTLDNAGMIARVGYDLYKNKQSVGMDLTAKPNLSI